MMTPETDERTTASVSPAAPRRRRHPQWKGDLALMLISIEVGLATGLGIIATDTSAWGTPDGAMHAISRITAMSGTALALVSVLLSSRMPWLEREVGQDRLIKWHRLVGPYSLWLILTHVLTVTIGYAIMDGISVWSEFWSMITTMPHMMAALLGFVFMMMIGVTSYKKARAKLKYETWWTIHLYAYLGVLLSFFHEVNNGTIFPTSQPMKIWWLAMHVITFAIVLWYRVLVPAATSLRYNVRVEQVVRENHNTVSVIMKGRNLDKLGARGGQFFGFRFIAKRYWWESHPYSISAAPRDNRLRITVKDLGDQSAWMADLQPGTRVKLSGPYGVFTADQVDGKRVTMIAGGVGITPIRALLEELPADVSVDIIWRASTERDLMLRDEVEALAAQRDARIHYLVGSRRQVNLGTATLSRLVPDIASTQVFICGPEGIVTQANDSLRALGVPKRHIHDEAFAY